MSRGLIAAFFASLLIHALVLVFLQVDWDTPPEWTRLRAELRLPPRPQVLSKTIQKEAPVSRQTASRTALPHSGDVLPTPADPVLPVAVTPMPDRVTPAPPTAAGSETLAAPAAAVPPIAARGILRYQVYRGTEGMIVGRAEHAWAFFEGNYQLSAMTETVGLAALIKPVRIELESRGQLTAGGLQPEFFMSRRNGAETGDNARFDWATGEVVLSRTGSRHALVEGTQDLLSFHYQLAYLPQLVEGVSMDVATSRKLERYHFQILGEESLETGVGIFRTLHLKTRNETTTELWLALDHGLLPVKIRHIDRKGDIYDQIVSEMGTAPE